MPPEPDHLAALWVAQTEDEPFAMSIDAIHTRAARFQSTIARRNRVEYAAAALVVVVFAVEAAVLPVPVMRIGAVLAVVGALLVAWNLHRQARAATRAEMEQAASSWIDFHRGELVRQRDALRRVWIWYLAPLAPGVVLVLAGGLLAVPQPMPLAITVSVIAGALAVVFGVFGFIGWVNSKAADALQAQIDALDAER